MTNNGLPTLTLTKLRPPRVGRKLVNRPHLLEQLTTPSALTLVIAPAGYGKTTLVSTWLDTCVTPHAWLSLDEHDNDLAVFVGYLLSALNMLEPVVTPAALDSISGGTLPPPVTIAHELLNDLAMIEQDFILVLDDYHVIRNQAIHALMNELLRHQPRALHLVMASRYDPALPLASLRAGGHVVELRRTDLCFTLEEAEQFLLETMGLSVNKGIVAALNNRTEGWPAGLRLAALSLRQQNGPHSFAAKALAGSFGQNRYIVDYLIDEVWSQLPGSIQNFLVQTSILDLLHEPLCDAVTGMTGDTLAGRTILEWLDQAELFITPVDQQHQWYRSHPLLRQMLQRELPRRHSQAEIAIRHVRASAWFAANGYLDEAVQHALQAGDVTAAAEIVAQHRPELMNQSQWQRLDRWIRSFPRAVVDQHPDLLLAEVWLKYIQQQLHEIALLLDRVESLLPGLPPDKARHLQGEVESRRSALLYWSGDLSGSGTLALHSLEKVPLTMWYVRGYTRLFLANSYVVTGDLRETFATFYATGEPDLGPGYQNMLLGGACILHWVTADLVGMVQTARRVVANSDPRDRAELVTFARHHVGLYHYQRNDFATAEEYLLPLVLQPYLSNAHCFLHSATLLARMRLLQHQPAEADHIAEVMLSFALETRSEVALFITRAFQAELALRQGRLLEAGQWAEQCEPFKLVPAPFVFVPHLVLAEILLAQDTPARRQQARELLAQMNEYYGSIHYTAIQIRVLALQAMLHYAEGNQSEALAILSNSIALAEPGGFLRLFVDLGPALLPLLRRLARRGVAPDYLNEILAAFGTGEALPRVEPLLASASALPAPGLTVLTPRELDVLDLLELRYTDREIAEALSISVETVRTHIRHLSEKLEAHGRRAIVEAAKDQRLLL